LGKENIGYVVYSSCEISSIDTEDMLPIDIYIYIYIKANKIEM